MKIRIRMALVLFFVVASGVSHAPRVFGQDDPPGGADVEPAFLRQFDRGPVEVLDRWTEVIGVGPSAPQIIVVKTREADGSIQVNRFLPTGQKFEAMEEVFIPDIRVEDKISPSLLEQFDRALVARPEIEAPRRTAIVWLVHEAVDGELPDVAIAAAGDEPSLRLEELKAMEPGIAANNQAGPENQLAQPGNPDPPGAYQATINAFLMRAKIDQERVVYRYAFAPAVALRLTRPEVAQMAIRDDVRFLFADEPVESEIDVAVPASLAPAIWNYFTGKGVSVAIVGEPGRVEDQNPNLNIDRNNIRYPNATPSAHATAIAGIIASQHPQFKGVSYDATIMSAGMGNSGGSLALEQATDWAIKRGAKVLLTCQGVRSNDGRLNWSDVYVDYVVHHSQILWIKSAGNQGGNGNHGRVTSPGRGFNSLVVGNIEDRATVRWSDDQMRYSSSFVDPVTGTEKPEIACYGTGIFSTVTRAHHAQTGLWIDDVGSGTSYSAPMVAGIAACCIERLPHSAGQPNRLRAKFLAGALAHNVEGSARLSDVDGAGAVKASVVLTGSSHHTISSNQFVNDRVSLGEVPLRGGEVNRVVICYSHLPSSRTANPTISSYHRNDLDLELYVNGSLVASSHEGVRNPFEIIDYSPASDVNAEIRIRRVSWDTQIAHQHVGLAWASQSSLGSDPGRVVRAIAVEEVAEKWKLLDPEDQARIWDDINASIK